MRFLATRGAALLTLVALGASGCGLFGSSKKSVTASPSARLSLPPTLDLTASPTGTVAASPTPTPTPSPSPTPKPSPSATPSPRATPSPKASVTSTVEITSGTGATQNVKLGTLLSLKIPQQSDAGYGWVFTKSPDAAILKVTGDQTVPFTRPPPAGTPGNNIHRWTFQPVTAGTTSFTVSEVKSADPSAAPIQTYTLTVVVAP
ncbi:MAG: hypothetical protein NVSMB32_14940 [Actinomycetota bacterium]